MPAYARGAVWMQIKWIIWIWRSRAQVGWSSWLPDTDCYRHSRHKVLSYAKSLNKPISTWLKFVLTQIYSVYNQRTKAMDAGDSHVYISWKRDACTFTLLVLYLKLFKSTFPAGVRDVTKTQVERNVEVVKASQTEVSIYCLWVWLL